MVPRGCRNVYPRAALLRKWPPRVGTHGCRGRCAWGLGFDRFSVNQTPPRISMCWHACIWQGSRPHRRLWRSFLTCGTDLEGQSRALLVSGLTCRWHLSTGSPQWPGQRE